MNNVTQYLRYLRTRKKISQAVLAEAMGISMRQVSRWERGGTESVHAETLFRALHFLGASYDLVQHLLHEEELSVEDIEWLADDQLREERTQAPRGVARNQPQNEQLFLTLIAHLFQNMTTDIRALSQRYLTNPQANVYQGQRNTARAHTSCLVLVNDQPLDTVRDWGSTLDIEWGYFGRGPASLAKALLLHEYGWQVAQDFGDDFLYDIIGHLPREQGGIEWTLTSDQMNRWLTVRRVLQSALAEPEDDSSR
jgi:transcriptional regulator with XRE-family HTH domain